MCLLLCRIVSTTATSKQHSLPLHISINSSQKTTLFVGFFEANLFSQADVCVGYPMYIDQCFVALSKQTDTHYPLLTSVFLSICLSICQLSFQHNEQQGWVWNWTQNQRNIYLEVYLRYFCTVERSISFHIRLETDMPWPSYINMLVANDLAPNVPGHQKPTYWLNCHHPWYHGNLISMQHTNGVADSKMPMK